MQTHKKVQVKVIILEAQAESETDKKRKLCQKGQKVLRILKQNQPRVMRNRQKSHLQTKREGKQTRVKPIKAAPPTLLMHKLQGKNQWKAQVLQKMKPMSVLRKRQEGNPVKKRGRRRHKGTKHKEVSLQ